MKDSELKERIQNAYRLEPSERQTAFVRTHRQRERKLPQLLMMQLGYRKRQYFALLLCLLGFSVFAGYGIDETQMRSLAAFLPFLSVFALADLGSSQRYGMEELEMSARLSRRMLKALRLAAVGLAGFLSILIATVLLKLFSFYSVQAALLLAGVPYLLTTSSCMMLIRKWHEKENIYGCIAIAACVCAASLTAGTHPAFALLTSSRISCSALFAATLLWAVWEFKIYLKESEEYQWNLC